MPELADLQQPIAVSFGQLLLDPNNPRLAELGQQLDAMPEARFAERRVQEQAYGE